MKSTWHVEYVKRRPCGHLATYNKLGCVCGPEWVKVILYAYIKDEENRRSSKRFGRTPRPYLSRCLPKHPPGPTSTDFYDYPSRFHQRRRDLRFPGAKVKPGFLSFFTLHGTYGPSISHLRAPLAEQKAKLGRKGEELALFVFVEERKTA